MTNFKKVVRLGTTPTGRLRSSVYCRIEYNRDGEKNLSISGVEGPLPSGNARGASGQIVMGLKAEEITPAPGWDTALIQKFLDVWNKWHLNNMQAGTPTQMAELKKNKFPGYPVSHYDWAKETLTKAGLQPDNGYSYGSKWLRVEVPEDVVEFLKSLPATDKEPAWV